MTKAAADPKAFKPTLVHAYRRVPQLNAEGKPIPAEVVFAGEKVLFAENADGHMVGLVNSQAVFDRLTKEIPEAYIPYEGGKNIPARPANGIVDKAAGKKFVLRNDDAENPSIVVLDDMEEEELRDFAAANDIEGLEPLKDDALRQAILNSFKTT